MAVTDKAASLTGSGLWGQSVTDAGVWYPGNNTDPTVTWEDATVNGNDGTLVGWTYLDGDRWDGAGTEVDPYCLECAGVSTQYVSCAGGAPGLSDFSIDVWAWIDNVADNYGVLLGSNPNAAAGFGLRVTSTEVAAYVTTTNYSDVAAAIIVSGTGHLGAWHHYGASFDRDGNERAYYDGAYVTQTSIAAKSAVDLNTAIKLLGYPGWTTQGRLAAVREYNTVLADADFATNYAAGTTGTGYVRDGLVLDLAASRAFRRA